MATITGIAAGPAAPRTVEPKRGGDPMSVLEIDVLDDTAGVIRLQLWNASPATTRALMDVQRGQTLTATVHRFSSFGAQVRAEVSDGDVKIAA